MESSFFGICPTLLFLPLVKLKLNTFLSFIKYFYQSSPSTVASFRLLSAKNILRPQLKFKEKINNKSGPFVPKIKEKPHSLKPLAILVELDDMGDEEFSHPYEFELERFVPDGDFLNVSSQVQQFKKVDDTRLVMVENEADLRNLIADLSNHSVIGVDLEVCISSLYLGIPTYRTKTALFLFVGPLVPDVSRDNVLDADFDNVHRLHCGYIRIMGQPPVFE